MQTIVDRHFDKVKLSSSEQITCQYCSGSSAPYIQYKTDTQPQVLIIHLKRFDETGSKIKQNVLVDKSITIDRKLTFY